MDMTPKSRTLKGLSRGKQMIRDISKSKTQAPKQKARLSEVPRTHPTQMEPERCLQMQCRWMEAAHDTLQARGVSYVMLVNVDGLNPLPQTKRFLVLFTE